MAIFAALSCIAQIVIEILAVLDSYFYLAPIPTWDEHYMDVS